MPPSAAARMGLRVAQTGLWVGHRAALQRGWPPTCCGRGSRVGGERDEEAGVRRPLIPLWWGVQGAGGRAGGTCRGSHPGFPFRFCGPGAAPEL